jgi:hypothetical protein
LPLPQRFHMIAAAFTRKDQRALHRSPSLVPVRSERPTALDADALCTEPRERRREEYRSYQGSPRTGWVPPTTVNSAGRTGSPGAAQTVRGLNDGFGSTMPTCSRCLRMRPDKR